MRGLRSSSARAAVTCLVLGLASVARAQSPEPETAARPAERAVRQLTSTATRGANARRGEFKADAYRFCHDEGFGESETEAADFCRLFDESSDAVCPEARRRCEAWRRSQRVCAPHEGSRVMRGTPDDPPGRAAEENGVCPGERGPSRIVLPEHRQGGMGWTLPPALSWTLIGGAALVFLVWFVRAIRGAGWQTAAPDLGEVAATEGATDLLALPETRSTALLDSAERALEGRDPAEAVRLVHLALLRFFDDEGLVRYHPSKTNGDYVRALRREVALVKVFRGVARETERIRFGQGDPDETTVRALLLEARGVVSSWPGRRPHGPTPAAALAVLITTALSAVNTACDPRTGHDAAFDLRAPTGMAALPKLLREAGLDVTVTRRPARIGAEVGVVVVRTSAAREGAFPEAIVMDGLLDRDVSLVLIDDLWQSRYFLPVTSTLSATRGRTDLEVAPPSPRVFCTWRLSGLAPALDGHVVRVPEGRRLVDDTATTATVSASAYALSIQPLLSYAESPDVGGREAAHAFVAERKDAAGVTLAGCLFVFADRDLFTNASLTREANARFAAAFFGALAAGDRKILIVDRLDADTLSGEDPVDPGWGGGGSGSDGNARRSLEASNMLPLLGQGAVTLLVLFAAMGAAFGPLREPTHREHKAFVEHVEAIGRQYARTGSAGLVYSARALARWVVNRHRDQVRGGAEAGWSTLAKHLAERHQLDERDVRAALRLGMEGQSELGPPGLDDPAPESERLLRTLSRLARLGSSRVE